MFIIPFLEKQTAPPRGCFNCRFQPPFAGRYAHGLFSPATLARRNISTAI